MHLLVLALIQGDPLSSLEYQDLGPDIAFNPLYSGGKDSCAGLEGSPCWRSGLYSIIWDLPNPVPDTTARWLWQLSPLCLCCDPLVVPGAFLLQLFSWPGCSITPESMPPGLSTLGGMQKFFYGHCLCSTAPESGSTWEAPLASHGTRTFCFLP